MIQTHPSTHMEPYLTFCGTQRPHVPLCCVGISYNLVESCPNLVVISDLLALLTVLNGQKIL